MRFRVPLFYDKMMDTIAMIVFPSRKYAQLTLAFYFILMAVVLIWWTGNWWWGLGVLLSVALAYIMFEWML